MARLIDADELRPDVRLKDGTLCFSKSRIANAPTIEPTTVYEFKGCDNCELERPKGKWIESDVPESMLWKCSVCGYQLGAHSFKYCPMCGADMRGDI